jgi:hypothetical protein
MKGRWWDLALVCIHVKPQRLAIQDQGAGDQLLKHALAAGATLRRRLKREATAQRQAPRS